jgi:beta-glucuronidase
VTRAGAEYYDACGIFIGYTTHSTVANSELFDLPYTGISAGWGWGGTPQPSSSQGNDFHQNLISHHMRALFDGGAIYLNGAQPGTTLVGNVVSNQAAATGDLYLDNGTQGVMASSNVVLIDAKADITLPDAERSYWVYVQVYPTIATNNSVTASFTNDPTELTPMPIDPSDTVTAPTDISTNAAPAASIFAGAGSPLRSPEIGGGKPATASSVYDSSHVETAANDGNAFDGWSPSATDTQPWWQVDLGGEFAIDAVEVVSRWAIDQPVTRRSYEVVASDDPSFATSTTLATVDATGLPHRAIFAADVSPAVTARYVRVRKTASEYFFLGEVRIHGTAAP